MGYKKLTVSLLDGHSYFYQNYDLSEDTSFNCKLKLKITELNVS